MAWAQWAHGLVVADEGIAHAVGPDAQAIRFSRWWERTAWPSYDETRHDARDAAAS